MAPRPRPSRALRRAGACLAILVGASVFLAALAVLALGAAFLGGPALVELGRTLSGR